MNVEKLIWRIWVSLLLFCYLMCSCGTKYVAVESVRYDSLYISKMMHDSIYVRDSVFVKEAGDTIFKDKYKYVYVYKNLVDTFYVYRDKEIEVPVPVEKELSWWEKQKLNFGGWVIGIMFLYVIVKIMKWFVKRTRKG